MLKKFNDWYYNKKAIRGLRKKYLLDLACDYIMKDWISACIIERKQEFRRKELVEKQAEVKEKELFLKWLKTLK